MRQTFLRGVLTVLVLALGTVAAGPAAAQTATTEAATSQAENWPATLAAARGQTVYWHAWAGDEKINRYIDWVAGTVRDRFGVDLRHVKVSQTGEVVALVLAEKAAGRTTGGSVDLVWLNGENFAAMKQNGLLSGPFTDRLPHFRLVDTTGKPTTLVDFTVPTDGLESPWGMAQLTFYYDSARLDAPPRSIAALGEWAKAHPGRFTYPAPPDFTGATFLPETGADRVDARSSRAAKPAGRRCRLRRRDRAAVAMARHAASPVVARRPGLPHQLSRPAPIGG
jgi:putative thiamine transport system substrate-binding protein